MRAQLLSVVTDAISEHVSSVAEIKSSDTSVAGDENWFSEAALDLLGTEKPGTALWAITGFEERSCQRYAAGHVKPTAYFLRTLLRSPQGWQWLAAAMEGSDAQWWRDAVRARHIKQAIDAVE